MTNGKGFLDQFNKPTPPVEQVEVKAPEAKTEETKEPIKEPETIETKEKIETKAPETEITPDPEKPALETKDNEQPELNDDKILEYLRSKGKEVTSLDDLFKEKQDVADPFEGLSDEVKDIIKFAKETNGRSIDDWLELNKDYKAMSPIDLARAKAKEATRGKLSSEEIDQYLEKKLNIDLTDINDLDKFDAIELENYSEDYLKNKLSEKEKFRTPKQDKESQEEFITLDNGLKIDKKSYKDLEIQRQEFVDTIKKTVDNIADFSIKLKIDDNGSITEYDIPYEYSKDDKHKMVSYGSDINDTVNKLFDTPEGFNHKALTESVPWMDPEYREKKITAIVHKALAKRTEELLSEEHNISFNKKQMPESKDGKRIVPIPGTTNPYAVKFNI